MKDDPMTEGDRLLLGTILLGVMFVVGLLIFFFGR
jgi:hypothetical protein